MGCVISGDEFFFKNRVRRDVVLPSDRRTSENPTSTSPRRFVNTEIVRIVRGPVYPLRFLTLRGRVVSNDVTGAGRTPARGHRFRARFTGNAVITTASGSHAVRSSVKPDGHKRSAVLRNFRRRQWSSRVRVLPFVRRPTKTKAFPTSLSFERNVPSDADASVTFVYLFFFFVLRVSVFRFPLFGIS